MNKSAIIVMLVVLFLVPGLAAAGFMDNGNGTVTDTTTSLIWQQCTAGWSGTGCATDNTDPNTYTWEAAITYCEGLSLGGFTDWRLPNIKELGSIVDLTKTSAPLINDTYFPATQSSFYWSSTSYAPDTTRAWYVNFNVGDVKNYGKTVELYVRCVR